jgi:hypothetical protein
MTADDTIVPGTMNYEVHDVYIAIFDTVYQNVYQTEG